jgi:hypothetical protein
MRHCTIHIGKNTVTKTAAPDLLRVEVEKTSRAFVIGRDSGLFRVPEILDYDETRGQVVFERIQGIKPVIPIPNKFVCIMEQVGRSLAAIHKMLSLPYDMAIPLPTELTVPGDEVFIHGDFNGSNVCFDKISCSLVILDWQMTSRHGGIATFGSRYFDIIWFINYVLWTPTIRHFFRDPIDPIAKLFLPAYFREANIPCNIDTLTACARHFFEMKHPSRKQYATLRTRHMLPRCNILTEKFIESIKSIMRDYTVQ